MRFSAAMMASFAALLAAAPASAMIDESDDQVALARRKLVKTDRGLAIENAYIATVLGNETSCKGIEQAVKQFTKSRNKFLRSAELQGEEEVHAMQIVENCFVAFTGDLDTVNFVKALPGVVGEIEQDFVVQIESDPKSWGLNRIDQPSLPLSKGAPFSASHTGRGVNIYVVDTGLNFEHNEFLISGSKRRASLGGDYINENPKVDNNGHGTHCAGTAGGSSYGIARDANVIGVKVLSGSGSGSTSGVIQGVEWAVKANKGVAGVISMSLGGGKNSAMNKAVEDAAKAGMIVVVAAGNENQDACQVSPASAGGSAKAGGVISVGSTTSTDARSSFSNFGKCVDIFAPGSSITSSWKGSKTAINTISGTSMATPHVAGVAAVLLEKHGLDKKAAQAELMALAVPNKVTNAGKNSPNLLLQVPQYTGPPTPPTPQPTSPPTMAPVTLCVAETTCTDFAPSTFGKSIDEAELLQGPLAVAKAGDGMLCSPTNENFKGKVVLVARGGCLFFEKVQQAEKQGAMAVLIHLTSNSETIFPPAYYGTEKVKIPSMMISAAGGKQFRAKEGSICSIGSKSVTAKPTPPTLPPSPTPNPTDAPTRAPTPRPTKSCSNLKRRDCERRSDCLFDRVGSSRSKRCFDPLTTPTAQPTLPPTLHTPSCERLPFADAQAFCKDAGKTLCSLRELQRAGNTPECSFDDEPVWSETACNRGRSQRTFTKATKRGSCVGRESVVAVRCCY